MDHHWQKHHHQTSAPPSSSPITTVSTSTSNGNNKHTVDHNSIIIITAINDHDHRCDGHSVIGTNITSASSSHQQQQWQQQEEQRTASIVNITLINGSANAYSLRLSSAFESRSKNECSSNELSLSALMAPENRAACTESWHVGSILGSLLLWASSIPRIPNEAKP